MEPRERQVSHEIPLTPIRKAGEGFGDQEALYKKHLLAATQDLRPNLLPLVGTMRWPVSMTDDRAAILHYSPEGHPPSLIIETLPFTPVISPVAARVVQLDAADPTDLRDRQVATIKLHAPDSHMTLVLKDLVATSLPAKLRDTVGFYTHPGVMVQAGEVLGRVGKVKITVYPKPGAEVEDNLLMIMMAYQPRGPSEQFSHYDTVDPLPFFHPLY